MAQKTAIQKDGLFMDSRMLDILRWFEDVYYDSVNIESVYPVALKKCK